MDGSNDFAGIAQLGLRKGSSCHKASRSLANASTGSARPGELFDNNIDQPWMGVMILRE